MSTSILADEQVIRQLTIPETLNPHAIAEDVERFYDEQFPPTIPARKTPPTVAVQFSFPTVVVGHTDEVLEEARQLSEWLVTPQTDDAVLPEWAHDRKVEFNLALGSQIRQWILYHELPPAWKQAALRVVYTTRTTISNVKAGGQAKLAHLQQWVKEHQSELKQAALVVGMVVGVVLVITVLAFVAMATAAMVGAAAVAVHDPVLAAVLTDGRIVAIAAWNE